MTLDSQRVHPNWLEDDRLRAIAELEGKDIRTLCEEMAEWQRKEQREIRDAHIQAGLRIDAATAEVNWTCTKIGDPYGFSAVMPWHASGKTYWACSLDEGTWVPFDDLPVATALVDEL